LIKDGRLVKIVAPPLICILNGDKSVTVVQKETADNPQVEQSIAESQIGNVESNEDSGIAPSSAIFDIDARQILVRNGVLTESTVRSCIWIRERSHRRGDILSGVRRTPVEDISILERVSWRECRLTSSQLEG
jgi:hypothetical protein